jgi:hypothetical protein
MTAPERRSENTPLTASSLVERVTGIEPALSAWESSGKRPLSSSSCYSCTSDPRTCPMGALESSPVRQVCETSVRGNYRIRRCQRPCCRARRRATLPSLGRQVGCPSRRRARSCCSNDPTVTNYSCRNYGRIAATTGERFSAVRGPRRASRWSGGYGPYLSPRRTGSRRGSH